MVSYPEYMYNGFYLQPYLTIKLMVSYPKS